MTDFDLTALVRHALATWKEPDPHVIARRLLTKIAEENLREALATCLPDHVRIEAGRQRMHQADVDAAPAVRPGQSRWKTYSPALMRRYCIGGTWKLLGDCTAADCDLAAADYAKRAAEQAALEARFRLLAERLRAEGVGRVADLSALPEVLAA